MKFDHVIDLLIQNMYKSMQKTKSIFKQSISDSKIFITSITGIEEQQAHQFINISDIKLYLQSFLWTMSSFGDQNQNSYLSKLTELKNQLQKCILQHQQELGQSQLILQKQPTFHLNQKNANNYLTSTTSQESSNQTQQNLNLFQQIQSSNHFQQSKTNVKTKYINIKKSKQQAAKKSFKKTQPIIIRQKLEINAEQVEILVKNFKFRIDLIYKYKKYSLQNMLHQFIFSYLQEYQITVYNPKEVIPILDTIFYQNSKQSGNYTFDPFCDAIQMYIRRKDKKQFGTNFRIIGKPQIINQQIQDFKKWTKSSNLRSTDTIEDLIKAVCEKKQQTQITCSQVIKSIKGKTGGKVIRDLFELQRDHYQKMSLQLTWAFQLYQIVQKIKYARTSELGQNRLLQKTKQQCIRTGNSHKVLRYLASKLYGQNELNNISKISSKNMKNAVSIVKQQIINDQLLEIMQQYFSQFCQTFGENQRPIKCQQGLILYGPPGTGKSQLTQSLPQLIGFHLISKGLSAADFNKSLVGQSGRMIEDLVNRATLSPHLVCSVGIDQIDGLVPDRKDKQQKNGQAIGKLLSMIGGNCDVPNLLYYTSTNYLKKIDEAIRRRLSGQFMVGRPNPEARYIVLSSDLKFLDEQTILYLTKITVNFTGAALKKLNGRLISLRNLKIEDQIPNISLSNKEITECAIRTASQFSITLGMYTFPEIYTMKQNNKYLFSQNFLRRIQSQFLLLKHQKHCQYQFSYTQKVVKYQFQEQRKQNKLLQRNQLQTDNITIQLGSRPKDSFQSFQYWLRKSLTHFPEGNIEVCLKPSDLRKAIKKERLVTTILLVKQQESKQTMFDTFHQQKLFQKPKFNLFIFYFVEKLYYPIVIERLCWGKKTTKYYTGRILVELNQQPMMAFELKTQSVQQTPYQFKYFMKSQKQNSANDVIPELVQFFLQREVSYILLLDYQMLLSNGAYDRNKIKQVIEQKMGQAKNYDKVAVIINLDRLLLLNQSTSDSSMGRSTSYSVSDQQLYVMLLHYMSQLPNVTQPPLKNANINQSSQERSFIRQINANLQSFKVKQKWVAMIVDNPELGKMIKKHLKLPKTPQQIKQSQNEQKLDKPRRCVRCKVYYTERQNQKQRKCVQHPGPLIDMRDNEINDEISIKQAILQQTRYMKFNSDVKDKLQNVFLFACCCKGLREQGECSYRHIIIEEEQQSEDQLYKDKKDKQSQWEQAAQNSR